MLLTSPDQSKQTVTMVRGSEAKPHALLERDGGEALLGKRAVIRSVRYVYQPMEALNLVVITNKASNIQQCSNAQQIGLVARSRC